MTADFFWRDRLELDVRFGYLGADVNSPRLHNPRLVLNTDGGTVLRTIREELKTCKSFAFSVAFVSPQAIALLKQELLEFDGTGLIVTSDYLAFNSPAAFAELMNLTRLGLEVRLHEAVAFHPKGYLFDHDDTVAALVGSSNLTANALVRNHEWNLKVSASRDSDLASQIARLIEAQRAESVPLTQAWIDQYAASYQAPASRPKRESDGDVEAATPGSTQITPNKMQLDALLAIEQVRRDGQSRAIIISATGTGKTILSALDVRAFNPDRLLFVVHREQILDRTIQEYQRVLGGSTTDYGKLTGTIKQPDRKFVFATVQTISQPHVLTGFDPTAFDYIVIDEAHRTGAESHQRIISHFSPRFLLGMTATPERTDSFNVFELFDYNVPYEIRLNHALEEEMLAPFHYYGVADVTFDDGSTTGEDTDLNRLISADRIEHLVRAIETYGQAGVPPRGLIFCSRKSEAKELSSALNRQVLRGRPIRTVALTGEDSIAEREARVEQLERGELDYILSVDVFNEGVDIPSINQVIMLRQTQSAIVFVQQLGRGLRRAPGKEYVVVIDFIGNYSNNYLIPIALFGDESLDRELLRQNLISAEEAGILPGLSSVRFDRIAQERVLSSIVSTKLDSMQKLKTAMETMRNRLGTTPSLWDFLRFESVDPVLLATSRRNYVELTERLLKVDGGLTADEHRMLGIATHEGIPAKRQHELLLLKALLAEPVLQAEGVTRAFQAAGLPSTPRLVTSAIESFTLVNHGEGDQKSYGAPIVTTTGGGSIALVPEFRAAYASSLPFKAAIDDLVKTGLKLISDRYEPDVPFTPGRQYSRKDTTRLLGWPRKWTSTLYGYRTDVATSACPIFVTLHKSDEVAASTAYADELIDPSTMLWYTRSRRTLESDEVRAIVENQVAIHVFVKKDDAEGSDFYYLGQARSQDAEQTTMPSSDGAALDVVRMHLHFDRPIDLALYDYFHPTLTVVRGEALRREHHEPELRDGSA